MEFIRPKVIVSLAYNDALLFIDVKKPITNAQKYIPVGGGLEFGESLVQGAIREVEEEALVKVTDLTYLGFHECVFKWGEHTQHHLIYHFYKELDTATYHQIPEQSLEANGMPIYFKWIALEELPMVKHQLLPSGIYKDYKAVGLLEGLTA